MIRTEGVDRVKASTVKLATINLLSRPFWGGKLSWKVGGSGLRTTEVISSKIN